MHSRFVGWYQWVFITNVTPLFGFLIVRLLKEVNESLSKCTNGCFGMIFGCSTLAWFITGLIWRFNSVGRFAAGDVVPVGADPESWNQAIMSQESLFQANSAKMMIIIYLLSFGAMALAIISCFVICSLFCCCGGKIPSQAG